MTAMREENAALQSALSQASSEQRQKEEQSQAVGTQLFILSALTCVLQIITTLESQMAELRRQMQLQSDAIHEQNQAENAAIKAQLQKQQEQWQQTSAMIAAMTTMARRQTSSSSSHQVPHRSYYVCLTAAPESSVDALSVASTRASAKKPTKSSVCILM